MQFILLATGPLGMGKQGGRLRHQLALLLSGELRVRLEVVALEAYHDLMTAMERGTAAIAWFPPAVYVEARERFGAELLGRCARHGHSSYRGALFVRRSSPRRTAKDLEGAAVGWVDPDSCSGYLFPRLSLLDRGVDPQAGLGRQRFLGSHAEVARAVQTGEVDVGATYVHVFGDHEDEIIEAGWTRVTGTESMRAVVISEPVPSDTICASPTMDPRIRAGVEDVLRGLHTSPEGQAILQGLFQAVAIEPADPEDYEIVQRAMEVEGRTLPG